MQAETKRGKPRYSFGTPGDASLYGIEFGVPPWAIPARPVETGAVYQVPLDSRRQARFVVRKNLIGARSAGDRADHSRGQDGFTHCVRRAVAADWIECDGGGSTSEKEFFVRPSAAQGRDHPGIGREFTAGFAEPLNLFRDQAATS
jgi:hypothetical protein